MEKEGRASRAAAGPMGKMARDQPQEIEIRTAFFRFAAKRWGDPRGAPILALHGWLDNAASFDRLAPFLPGVHLVAMDLAGHGYSDHRPDGSRYHVIDHVADVIEVIEALGWDRFALLGHSLGAGIASLAAGVIPERVSHLILIEGLGPVSRPTERAPQHLLRSVRRMEQLATRPRPVFPDVESAVRARLGGHRADEGAVAALVRRGLEPAGDGWTWRSDPKIRVPSPLYMTEDQVHAFLDRVTAPVLLILGEHGRLRGRGYLEPRCSRLKRLDVRTLPGGHSPHLDHPETVAGLIREFLGRP